MSATELQEVKAGAPATVVIHSSAAAANGDENKGAADEKFEGLASPMWVGM
jgi:hypothetical protein